MRFPGGFPRCSRRFLAPTLSPAQEKRQWEPLLDRIDCSCGSHRFVAEDTLPSSELQCLKARAIPCGNKLVHVTCSILSTMYRSHGRQLLLPGIADMLIIFVLLLCGFFSGHEYQNFCLWCVDRSSNVLGGVRASRYHGRGGPRVSPYLHSSKQARLFKIMGSIGMRRDPGDNNPYEKLVEINIKTINWCFLFVRVFLR